MAVVVYFVALRKDDDAANARLIDRVGVTAVSTGRPVVGAPPRIVELPGTDPDTSGAPASAGTDGAVATATDTAPESPEGVPAPPLAPIAPEDLRPKPQAPLEIYRQHVGAAKKLYDRGKLAAAVKEYQQAIEIFPRGVSAYRELGNIYNELDRNEEALKYLRKGLRIAPRDADLHLTLGTVYQTLGKDADAKRAYERYLALKPNGKFADDLRAILADMK